MSEGKKAVKTAVKITLGKRVVILRNPDNGDIDNAMKMAHLEMGDDDDKTRYMYKMQQNLIKELLISVDGDKDVRQPLGDMFSLQEQACLNKVLSKMTGLGNALTVTEEVITL